MEAQIVTMKQFRNLMNLVSSATAICVRGRHAIGKSEGVYQGAKDLRDDFYKDAENCARMVEGLGGKVKHADGWVTEWTYEMGLPVVERRLSQMTEGDLIGLPQKTEDNRATEFLACDWVIQACDFPVVVFLDERNRALPGVKQTVFQLTDSKAFYNNLFHDGTRVVIAENVGDEYQVESLDPAEISRCITVELDPSVAEWLEYAKTRCNPATVEFIRSNQNLLEHKGVHAPNKKYPDRRAWVNFDRELTNAGLFDDPTNSMIRCMAGAFCGTEVANKFAAFLAERNKQVAALDILENWAEAKARLATNGAISNDIYVEAVAKLQDHIEKLPKSEKKLEKAFPEKHLDNFAAFMADSPGEIRMTAWSALYKNPKLMIRAVETVRPLIVGTANALDISPETIEGFHAKAAAHNAPAAKGPGRGARQSGKAGAAPDPWR